MDMLEEAGLSTMVGKVNMDRNCPDYLREESAEVSAAETVEWIKDVLHKKYKQDVYKRQGLYPGGDAGACEDVRA